MTPPSPAPRPDEPRDDFDRAISAALRKAEPPPGLRERLQQIPETVAATAAPANVVPGPWAVLSRRTRWLAAAALLAVAALFGWRWQADRRGFDEFRLAAANDIVPRLHGPERPGKLNLDFLAEDSASIAAWLRAKDAPEPMPAAALLRADAGFGPVGCLALEWHGVRYSLACFYTPDGRSVHLFTIPLAAFPAAGVPAGKAHAEVRRIGGRDVAAWSDGTLARVLVAAEGSTSLPAVLAL